MEYNILGETDLRINKLSFGASSLGSVFRPVDEDDAIGAVHTALDLGINFIDVSPYYGNTVAETVSPVTFTFQLRRIKKPARIIIIILPIL